MTVDLFSDSERAPRHASGGPLGPVTLLQTFPDLQRVVPQHDRRLADRALTVPTRSFQTGPLIASASAVGVREFAWIVQSGLMLRRTFAGERSVVEIIGPGDLVDLTHDEDDASSGSRTSLVAHELTNVAVLDDRFRLAARRWPGLHDVIHEHQARQHRRTCRHLAVLALPRVEDRVVAVMCDLAERWGRVTPAGVRLDLTLTHSLLGELVASRRPTVSLALAELASQGVLSRPTARTWLLSAAVAVAA
jgi:CRP/FNR family transcriptional regulator, cyclic AMP receptor protein